MAPHPDPCSSQQIFFLRALQRGCAALRECRVRPYVTGKRVLGFWRLQTGIVELADIDNDGLDDLGHCGDFGVHWSPSVGAGLDFTPVTDINTSSMGQYCDWVDYDGDGDPDLIAGQLDSLTVYRNDERVFSAISLAAEGVRAVASADFDGDGDIDIAGDLGLELAWYPNNGSGFDPGVIVAPAEGFERLFAADLDQDGDVDLIGYSDARIAWLENLGGGGFAGAEEVATGDFNSLDVGDLNGDGLPDLLVGDGVALSWIPNATGDPDLDGFEGDEDCGPLDANVFPGAEEIIDDGVDQDCDGGDLCIEDADLDGFGGPNTFASDDLDCLDDGEATEQGDCDDGDAAVFPMADEACDGRDTNCDGQIDEECDGSSPKSHSKADSGCGCQSAPASPYWLILPALLFGHRRDRAGLRARSRARVGPVRLGVRSRAGSSSG